MATTQVIRQRKSASSASVRSSSMREDCEKGDVQRWRVFSSNPDKAWAEKWFLAYSPIWPMLFVGWCMSGLHLQVGDAGNLIVTVLIAAPNVVVPALFAPRNGLRWYEMYWFKFSWWIFLFAFVASYFFTEYFFDVLGMVYDFPHLKWNLDSRLVGSGKQVVPLMMYFHAWYFFITYHSMSIIFIRIIRTAPVMRDSPFAQTLSVFASSWLFAWGEIFLTTMDTIEDQFTYKNMDWALTYGALCYACYFIPSFPMSYELDETTTSWSFQKTTESALAAAMIAFVLLDIVAQYFITQWQSMGF